MKVLVVKKIGFEVQEFTSVTSIGFSSGTYTIVAGSVSKTFSSSSYMVVIVNQ